MKQNIFCRLFVFLLFFSIPLCSIGDLMAAELAPHLYKTKLANGLTILVKETPGTKVATVQLWVKAGSVYEDAKEGGITHLIEHMIFKGTPTRGPGALAGAIEEVGGQVNAYTSFEYTVYHATLSARHWGMAADVLTDALLHATFDPDELEREKKVVLEELQMREDRPTSKLFQDLMSKSYNTHPYRLPIIGTRESVSSFTRQDILNYVKKHYHPDNFTVVVVGDVRNKEVTDKFKKLMGQLAKGNYQQPELAAEKPKTGPIFFTSTSDILQSHLALSFPIPKFNAPDTPVMDVISAILGYGEASRLYNQLRNKKGLVYSVNASAFTPHDPGLFELTATMDAKNTAKTLEAALQEVFKLKYLPVAEDELARAKRNLESDFVFALERAEGQARVIGSFEFLTGDPRENDYLEKVRAVSSDDIMRVAKSYFLDNALTAGVLNPKGQKIGIVDKDINDIIKRAENLARHGVPSSLLSNAFLPNVHKFKLKNGIQLLVREDSNIPTIAIRVVFPGGLRGESQATNGAFAFITDLLPRGTEKLSSREMALKVADMAGEISGFNGKNTFGLKADFLARYLKPGLKLVGDIIRKPAFDTAEAEKIRPEMLARLKQQKDSIASFAFKEFNRILFQGHPYGLNTLGNKVAIKNFKVSELKDIYHQYARPDKMVISIAGDVKADEVLDLVEKYFADWPTPTAMDTGIEEESFLPPDPPAVPEIYNIPRDKEQVHIIIGFLGTTMFDKDRYPLEILESVLSGQSGRLFTELRDKRSMAYSLTSFSLAGLDTGSFGIYIGTSPDKKDAVIKALWQELFRARTELISKEELKRAQNILISQYELGLQTHSSQAMEMALNATYKLGQDYGKKYIKAIEKVTAKEVRTVAQKYIQPDNYVLVSAGARFKPEPPPVELKQTKTPAAKAGAQPEMNQQEKTSKTEISAPAVAEPTPAPTKKKEN